MARIKGRAWKLGDGISTDHILPGRYFHLRSNPSEMVKHILEDTRPDFISKVREGDFLVGGWNFGQGSSREHAPIVIQAAGIRAVLAKSFARIFFRNCINVGLPVAWLNTDGIDEGDELEMDPFDGRVFNLTKKETYLVPPLPPAMANIFRDGGLVEHIRKHGRFQIDPQ